MFYVITEQPLRYRVYRKIASEAKVAILNGIHIGLARIPMDIITCLMVLLLAEQSIVGEDYVNWAVEQDSARKQLIGKFKTIETVLTEGYELVSRTSVTIAFSFKTYRNIAVLQYEMPSDVVVAQFSFQVEDILTRRGFGSCEPEDVFIHLKHGSYPAVNPDGIKFPGGFIDKDSREKIHIIQLKSSGDTRTYTITNPRPGGWFAIAYLRWQETSKIEQQGLAVDCDAALYTDLQVKKVDTIIVDCYSDMEINVYTVPIVYKCMLKDEVANITLKIKINDLIDMERAKIKMNGISLPSTDVNVVNCFINLPMEDFQNITFQPCPMMWHYIVVERTEQSDQITECKSNNNVTIKSQKYIVKHLAKDNKGILFGFDYNIPSAQLTDSFSVLNITSKNIHVLRFYINPTQDIGGTMALAATLLMTLKYQMGYKRLPVEESLLEFSDDDQFFKVVICQNLGHTSVPISNGSCQFNGISEPAMFIVNSTDSHSISDGILIPFPEGGVWYLSIRLFCDEVVCPCQVTPKGSKTYYVESDSSKVGAYNNASKAFSKSRTGVSECKTTLKLSISSMPCVFGKCSDRGGCLFVISGSSVMSSCSCSIGYAGWDCSMDAVMDLPLLSVLLLTFSNLLFVVSIYTATVRKYFTEAFMYTFTMIFSIFYHACDAAAPVSFCITNKNLLQFGDFYCGIMSFWVTLLAISIMRRSFLSTLQMTGAVIVACFVSWNRTNVMSFAIPVVGGVGILICTWLIDFRRSRLWRYPRKYYQIQLPVGLLMVTVGLICYAFLQTDENYKYVHSFWHVTVALSVACLLPDENRR